MWPQHPKHSIYWWPANRVAWLVINQIEVSRCFDLCICAHTLFLLQFWTLINCFRASGWCSSPRPFSVLRDLSLYSPGTAARWWMGCVFVCWCVASWWDRQTSKPCWFHVFYGFLIFLSHFTLCAFFSITRLANEVWNGLVKPNGHVFVHI